MSALFLHSSTQQRPQNAVAKHCKKRSELRWSHDCYLSCCCRCSAEACPSSARAAGPVPVPSHQDCPPAMADPADPDPQHRRGLRSKAAEAACGLRRVMILHAEHAAPTQEAQQPVPMPCCQACCGANCGVYCSDPHMHARVGSMRRKGVSSSSSAAGMHACAGCAVRCLC